MIKLTLRTKSGGPLVLLGLSAANLRELRDGKPIYVLGEQLGVATDIAIMFGATEQSIVSDLTRHGMIPPDRKPDEPNKA